MWLFSLIFLSLLSTTLHVESATYAILVSTAQGVKDGCAGNISDEIEVVRMYHTLIRGGVPSDNIFIFMNGEMMYSPKCYPWPGHLYWDDSKTFDMLPALRMDYNGSDMYKENFFGVIHGNKSGVEGGTGRVLESGPEDDVFIHIGGHGGDESIGFGNRGGMSAQTLREALDKMIALKKFKHLFIEIDTCDSGSMFATYLHPEENIYAMTASDPTHGTAIVGCGKRPNTTLGFCDTSNFVKTWRLYSTNRALDATLQDDYAFFRQEFKDQRISEYGNLNMIKKLYVNQFQGYPIPPIQVNENKMEGFSIPKSFIAPYIFLKKQLEAEPELANDKEFMGRLERMEQERAKIQKLTKSIVQLTLKKSYGSEVEKILTEKTRLTNFKCHQKVLNLLGEKCPKVNQSPFIEDLLNPTIHLCNQNYDEETILSLIEKNCDF